MFKLALNAGHSYLTAGKRTLKAIDPNETREYVLNKRVCDKIQSILSGFDGIDILRIDDGSEIPLRLRTDRANSFNADFYLSIHHNAGIYGGTGGGIEAYVYLKVDDITLAWQKDLYEALIKETTLRGNRATPLKSADFAEVRDTKMPAVLLELGFMDSRTDTPIILNEAFSDKAAKACAEVIIKKAKLTPKAVAPVTKPSVEEIAKEVIKGLWGNGEQRRKRLTEAGYDYTEVQSIVNSIVSKQKQQKSTQEIAKEVIKGLWGNGQDRKNRLKQAGYDYKEIQNKVNELLR